MGWATQHGPRPCRFLVLDRVHFQQNHHFISLAPVYTAEAVGIAHKPPRSLHARRGFLYTRTLCMAYETAAEVFFPRCHLVVEDKTQETRQKSNCHYLRRGFLHTQIVIAERISARQLLRVVFSRYTYVRTCRSRLRISISHA